MTPSSNETVFEEPPCPLCGGSAFRPLIRTRDWYYGVPGEYTVSKCLSCSLVMQNPRPRPEEMSKLYPEEYEPHTIAVDSAEIKAMIETQEPRRRLLEQFAAKGRNLDLGSGDGRFMLCLERAGWETAGVEFIEKMARYQRESLGLDVRTGDLHSAAFPNEFFDSVTMWSVLEHLYDPVEALREIRRILKPGGIVIAGVPNFASFERAVFGRYWFGLFLPCHLFFFTPASMKKTAEAADLKVVQTSFSSTATNTIQSVKKVIEVSRGKNGAPHASASVPQDNSPSSGQANVPSPGKEQNGEGASGSPLKKLIFNFGLIPALRLIDALHLGGTTNYVFRK